MSELYDDLTAALAEQGGGEVSTTPAPEAPQPESGEPRPAGDESTDTPESEAASWLDELRREHGAEVVDRIYQRTDAELKRGVTPKLQRLSELEKQYADVDPTDAEFLRQVAATAAWNPQAAADMLERAKQQLLGPYAPPPQGPQTPEAEPEFYSERERELWLDQQQAKRELAELRAWRQQETQARNMAQINERFARLEAEIGRQLPTEERNQVAAWCMKNAKRTANGETLLHEVDHAWKLMNWDKARAAARSEASSIVERKAGIGAGPSTTVRGDSPPREPKTLQEALRASMGLPLTE